MRVIAIGLVLLFGFFLAGCAPTLEYQKAGAQATQREQVIQAQLAAQIRQQRVRRLARVANSLKAAARTQCRMIDPEKTGCDYPVKLTDDQEVNAFADGKQVYIPVGMLKFAESDDELAYVISHELAHNMLNHMGKKRGNAALGTVVDVLLTAATGVSTQGAFGKAARQAYSQGFESEADYLGMYIAASAGYDTSLGPLFWRRMAIENPAGIIKRYNSTHPSTPERFVALTKTIGEIQTKYDQGLAMAPNSIDGPQGQSAAEIAGADVGAARGVSTSDVARTSLAANDGADAVVMGPRSFSLARRARKAGCVDSDGFAPPVSMIEHQGPVEVYDAFCYGAPPIRYRCEWQDCQVVDGP